MVQNYAEILEDVLTKEHGLVKFFGKINFPFSEKQQAEKILFEALNIIVAENVKTHNDQLLLNEKKKDHGEQDNNANEEEVVEEMCMSDYDEFTDRYQKMDNDKKWELTTGKIVEDGLYEFWMKCKYEHLSHSFIVDPNDHNYIVENVFTLEELNEIKEYKYKKLPDMPIDLLKYLNSFRKYNTQDLRKLVLETQSWDMPFNRDTHFDFDWIRNSIYNLLREYEAKNLEKGHLELWYLIHIWCFIDRCFESIDGVEAVRQENKKKYESKTFCNCINKAKDYGRRADFLICHISTEYACSEVGKIFDGENGTKLLKERGKKTPKMMKDIFDNLCIAMGMKEEKIRRLQSIGFVHANLMVALLRLDSPEGYICRVSRTKMFGIPAKVDEFGFKAIHVIMLAWKAKMVVRNMIDLVKQNDATEFDEEKELKELQNGCESLQHLLHLPPDDSQTPPLPSPKQDTAYLTHCSNTPQKRIRITNER
ncbi:18039_t:CDS:10 [Funneliformis geosporum]|uniref:6925_t:CDS:1 n=1 Tax=Funneliformis geosporum TaxID=1117311 RepID=A0A9W4SER4_9GLOM|nr:6925_t:CDS:10 [Funneliformis geosporum]CAI2166511.1 18039_t:CDS:10 [Funneliformis geosporum]